MSDRPSFSIVLETENLANVPFGELSRCLDLLARQEVSPARANEVLLINSGEVPAETLSHLAATYPWLTIVQSDAGTGYFEAKMAGARRSTGDIVVFCDADCAYRSDWLQHMLEPFARRPDIDVVAGETALKVTGPYSLAMMLIWSFPPLSRRQELYPSADYLANNVAFRRAVLRRCPIPLGLPVYRGNGALHARQLRRMGYRIWRQPKARATHPLPGRGPRQFLWRWLVYGHDQLIWERFVPPAVGQVDAWHTLRRSLVALLKLLSLGSWKPLRRLPVALREDPRRLAWLPGAVGVIALATTCALIGFLIACARPGSLVEPGARRLREVREAVEPVEATAG